MFLAIRARFIGHDGRITNIVSKDNIRLTYMRSKTKWW